MSFQLFSNSTVIVIIFLSSQSYFSVSFILTALIWLNCTSFFSINWLVSFFYARTRQECLEILGVLYAAQDDDLEEYAILWNFNECAKPVDLANIEACYCLNSENEPKKVVIPFKGKVFSKC